MFTFDEKFFLAISFFAFAGLMVKYIGPKLTKSLDQKSKEIAEEILAAKELKEKAAKLLEKAEKYHQESLSYADKLRADAELEAQKFVAEAEKSISDELEKKTVAANNRIKFAEEKAIAEIKESIVNAALSTIESEAAKGLDKKQNDFVLSQAIGSVEKFS
ncbi:MAG: ATP synthase F0 subunit B [Rickettsiales bacterium]|nr:ATP synthase F0 subunit B [Rickettsiales bacterium]